MLQDNSMAFDICRSLYRTVGFALGISKRNAIQQLPPFALSDRFWLRIIRQITEMNLKGQALMWNFQSGCTLQFCLICVVHLRMHHPKYCRTMVFN